MMWVVIEIRKILKNYEIINNNLPFADIFNQPSFARIVVKITSSVINIEL